MTPTQRSLRYLRELGYIAEVVERWNHHTQRRHDLFGFGDILAVKPGCTVLVQVTSGSNSAARVSKIVNECHREAKAWLSAGNEIEVHGWRALADYRKDGRRKKRDRWVVKLFGLTREDFDP